MYASYDDGFTVFLGEDLAGSVKNVFNNQCSNPADAATISIHIPVAQTSAVADMSVNFDGVFEYASITGVPGGEAILAAAQPGDALAATIFVAVAFPVAENADLVRALTQVRNYGRTCFFAAAGLAGDGLTAAVDTIVDWATWLAWLDFEAGINIAADIAENQNPGKEEGNNGPAEDVKPYSSLWDNTKNLFALATFELPAQNGHAGLVYYSQDGGWVQGSKVTDWAPGYYSSSKTPDEFHIEPDEFSATASKATGTIRMSRTRRVWMRSRCWWMRDACAGGFVPGWDALWGVVHGLGYRD
ncbi:uncharacterized protein BDZ99DRAFT_493540 [Mytilinidion resinicola]|uniref:Uncharacterized protein n=1 Tax=Mytilinidion resinicola TaxID=574789 RepID=A0A6A6Z9K9_9PEZI|nr:uncharacterized protein BDZ99DRAFT_493540 [Mytilinidion resinicola]KAF2817812.1 hypothetical protein BDZ99DRAFT_493540 [Mytilinidion resinicola]